MPYEYMNLLKIIHTEECFCNVNINNLENVLQKIYEQMGLWNTFLEYLEAEILKNFLLSTKYGLWV